MVKTPLSIPVRTGVGGTEPEREGPLLSRQRGRGKTAADWGPSGGRVSGGRWNETMQIIAKNVVSQGVKRPSRLTEWEGLGW